jgi:hypothetical protein
MTKWMLVLIPCLAAACATTPLTPEQSADLEKVRRFADEVTEAYGVPRVQLKVYERVDDPFFHGGRTLGIGANYLGHGDVRRQIVVPLAVATLDPFSGAPTGRRHYLFDFCVRAVEIYVRFLGVPPREAVDWAGGIVGQLVHAQRLPRDYFGDVHPCDLRRYLWTYLRMAEPMPGLGCASASDK